MRPLDAPKLPKILVIDHIWPLVCGSALSSTNSCRLILVVDNYLSSLWRPLNASSRCTQLKTSKSSVLFRPFFILDVEVVLKVTLKSPQMTQLKSAA